MSGRIFPTAARLLLSSVALGIAVDGCGGCPRRGATSTTETEASASTQTIAAHETADHTIAIDTPLVIADAGEPLDPGPLPVEAVHAVVLAEGAELRRCYARLLSESPASEGTLVLALDITPEGAVRSARVEQSTLGDGLVSDCIAARAHQWHFPASHAGAHVRYPFVLRRAAPAAGEP